jgi:AcrR family transcriptional regulator
MGTERMTKHGDVRQKILDAAEQRLWHYGFKKTTIDEIASDAGVGKGTVYLYFEGKEDIALAIMAQFKEVSLREIEEIAHDPVKTPVQKLKEMLQQPMIRAYQRCQESPATLELVVAIKPHIQARLRPYLEQEYALLGEVLEEGNARGVFDVPDTLQAARTLKTMCLGFLPPYPCAATTHEIAEDISEIVDLTVRGLRKP